MVSVGDQSFHSGITCDFFTLSFHTFTVAKLSEGTKRKKKKGNTISVSTCFRFYGSEQKHHK